MHCPECETPLQDGTTCRDHFHQMLFWEAEDPARAVVHHLMVLCYHLQHPGLYAQDGLSYARSLLLDFLVRGLSTDAVRKRRREQVASGNRAWTVTARPDSIGVYDHPVRWTMTAADVVAAGADAYCDRVRDWAQSVRVSLRESGNIPESEPA